MNEAGSGKREAGGGKPEAGELRPFAEVMREQGMTPPPALRESMSAAFGGSARDGGEHHDGEEARDDALSADDLLRAAENLLDKILATQCENRDSALDLLTVDALVTRAMEMAARDPQSLAEFPELAMKKIAAK